MNDRPCASGRPGFNWEAKAWLAFWCVVAVLGVLTYLQSYVWQLRGTWLAQVLLWVAVILLLGGGGGGIMFGGWCLRRLRTNTLADVAQSLHMEFLASPGDAPLTAFEDFSLFGVAETSYRNLMLGKSGGRDVLLLDHESGRNLSQMHTTVVIFPEAAQKLPAFLLTPRLTLTGSANSLFNLNLGNWPDAKIGSETHKAFAAIYRVGGASDGEVRAFFAKQLMDFFADNKNWNVESINGHLAVYKVGRRYKPREIVTLLEKAGAILQSLQRAGK